MKRGRLIPVATALLLGAVLTLLIVGLRTAKDARYQVTDLGRIPGPSNFTQRRDGGYRSILDINNAGQILVVPPRPWTPYILDATGTRSDLPKHENMQIQAKAVNNLGEVLVAGFRISEATFHKWTPEGGLQACGRIGNVDANNFHLEGFSDRGTVGGWAIGTAYVWNATTGTTKLPKGLVRVFDVNNRGEAVASGNEAVIWSASGGETYLGRLGYPDTVPMGINNRGEVMGYSSTMGGLRWKLTSFLGWIKAFFGRRSQMADGRSHAFHWKNGKMRDLNDLISADSGWTLRVATAVNDRGRIVGSGELDGETHAFLLTPFE